MSFTVNDTGRLALLNVATQVRHVAIQTLLVYAFHKQFLLLTNMSTSFNQICMLFFLVMFKYFLFRSSVGCLIPVHCFWLLDFLFLFVLFFLSTQATHESV